MEGRQFGVPIKSLVILDPLTELEDGDLATDFDEFFDEAYRSVMSGLDTERSHFKYILQSLR